MEKNGAKTLKRKLPLIIAGVLVLALLGFAVTYVITSKNKTPEIAKDGVVTVDQGDIVSTFSSSATVQSGRQGVFEILDGTKVKAVNFRVGDIVSEGDVIATFDTASLDEMLRLKKQDYDNANKTYKDYLKSMSDAPKQRTALQEQIKALEKTIATLQAEQTATTTAANTAASAATATENKQLSDLKAALTNLLGNTRLAESLVNAVLAENGSVGQTITAFQNLLGGSFMMDPSALTSMMGSMGAMGNTELISASLQLVQFKVQEAMLGVQTGTSLESVYKTVAESAENAYRAAEQTVTQLKAGWVAAADGVIREINIVAGEPYQSQQSSSGISTSAVTSALASLAAGNMDITPLLAGMFTNTVKGLVVEYHPFAASFLLAQNNKDKISLDQPVQVISVSGKVFEGTVSFISPVATESSDLVSSLIGGGGSTKGVEARVIIPDPDTSITIGLDVKISIDLETKTNAVRVPMESVQYDETGKSYVVFLYDAEGKKVVKQPVKMGIYDDVYYEITEGLAPGAQIIRVPQRGLKDGDKVKVLE
ncbi:MAG: hypothetical protein LBS96_06180 [Oscillospiraceae bacterium]|jgi:multidrug efflux pump subunit AcrA (membrane-fusion protein)|nr:hypothetical protein [Oscillospiraceae bacterium]